MRKVSIFLLFLFTLILPFSHLVWADQAQEILSKNLEAMGGRQNLEKIKTSYVEVSVTYGGLQGEVKSWSVFPNISRQDVDFKVLKISSGCDGKIYWSKDQNGKVNELGELEKSPAWTENYFFNNLYFYPDKFPRELKLLGEEKDSLGEYFVLEIKPQGGDSRKLFINKKTYLIDKSMQKQDIITITTYYSDYRVVDGIKTAFTTRNSTGNPQYDSQTKVTLLKFNEPIDPSLFEMPKEKVEDYVFLNPEKKTTVPFELTSNHIYIEVMINKSFPAWMILDTGAGSTCLDMSFAKKIGIESAGKFEAQGAGGSDSASLLKVNSVQLEDLLLREQNGVGFNLVPLEMYEGREINGILGYDLISRFVVEIDYYNKNITFYDPKNFQYSGQGEILDLEFSNNTPHIKAKIDGNYEGLFVLDTGSRKSLTLHAPFVKQHKFLEKYPNAIEAFAGAGIGGEAKALQTRIKSLQIGSFIINEPMTGLSTAQKGAFVSEKFQGSIGGGILKRFRVILDYGNKKMILEKNPSFNQKDEYDKTGMLILWKDKKFVVQQIVKNSPAEKAKIKMGDELLSLNGKPANAFTLEQMREMFQDKDGTVIKVEMKRGEGMKKFELKLKSLI
jgi:hypothetical protein